jgi:hypothetical protein
VSLRDPADGSGVVPTTAPSTATYTCWRRLRGRRWQPVCQAASLAEGWRMLGRPFEDERTSSDMYCGPAGTRPTDPIGGPAPYTPGVNPG